MDKLTIIALCFAFGSIIGSFLAVCAFRIPMGKYEPVRSNIPEIHTHLSPLYPRRSFCPHCRQQLKWYHTIPILSWIALGGKCAFCKASIPFRYCAIELIAGVAAILCYLRFGVTPTAAFAFVVVCALIVITYIDIDYMIIPDVITYPGTLLGVLLGTASSYMPLAGLFPLEHPFTSSLAESLLGIALGAGSLYAAWWLYLLIRKREGLGLGDIKLLAMLGALFGYECALITIFIGSVLGSVIGLALIAFRRHEFSNYISFGPYLIVAAVIYIFDFANLIHHLQTPEDTTLWRAF
jgi:leader peptidase (prepilin peptidase)/N-methyltransferase